MFQRAEEKPEENQFPTGQVRGQRWSKKQFKVTGNSTGSNIVTIRKNSIRG